MKNSIAASELRPIRCRTGIPRTVVYGGCFSVIIAAAGKAHLAVCWRQALPVIRIPMVLPLDGHGRAGR